jgi:exonuclease III
MRTKLKVLPAVVAAGCLVVLVPSSAAPAAEQRLADTDIRIASYNVNYNVNLSVFGQAVGDLLPRVDIAALQEVNKRDKHALLQEYEDSGEWGYYNPPPLEGYQNAVLWRTDRFAELSTAHPRISPRWFIGDENPKVGRYQKEKFVAIVRLEDRLTQKKVTVIDVHLINGAIRGGKRRPGMRRTYNLLVHQIDQLKDIVKKEKPTSDKLFVLGDYNIGWVLDKKVGKRKLVFETMKRIGMKANWATEHPKRRGTQGRALMDQIYSENKALAAKVFFGFKYSDHRPAYGLYDGS